MLNELHAHMAEGEPMIARFAEAATRMAEGSMLDEELVKLKEQSQLIISTLREDKLLLGRANEELARVKAQVAELQAKWAMLVKRRDRIAATMAEKKSSVEHLLKEAAEKKALALRKLD
ncbi:hypothetical protein L3X38_031140 [Prunus dulcis]|uniref:Uncharacterized protein n=1 Tax=Prunus dulcis TaxID=3755 RepID=A0AAD4VBX7_PRUDU|nr:hypothetical protein L3X38_031140 [Prunus dulcis]